jgi:L-fuconate dehydratase
MSKTVLSGVRIERIEVEDIRFRFPPMGSGSDAINPHTDYSNPYVTIHTSAGRGVGIGFSLGRGNELICLAVEELAPLLEGELLEDVVTDFGRFWWILANPVQARWIAPNAGPYHMAAGAIANGLFDLWAKLEQKPLWEVLAVSDTDLLLDMMSFRYVAHHLSRTEAREILDAGMVSVEERMQELAGVGLPSYFTTWIGTGTEALLDQIEAVRRGRGVSAFKIKVGKDLDHDIERCSAVRDRFGDSITLLTDANQVFSVPQAIEWMRELARFDVRWIEEPLAPDLVDGHAVVREKLADVGIHVVSGENCPNSHVATQFIGGGAVDRFQIDACRVMGPPENMLIMLVAAKYGIPVCPHAGGSGLDELVPHLAAWNYARCARTLDDVLVEQVGFCSEYFRAPSRVGEGRIVVPTEAGYIVGMKDDARERFAYPGGPAWTAED